MKKRTKLIALILAAVMVFGSFGFSAFAAGRDKAPELKFDENGNFRILHIADTHFTDFPFEESLAFIGAMLDDYKPDLVVFGGDNIKGWFDTSMQLGVKAAIDKLAAPLDERGIPFTFVFGNHDWEAYLCPKKLQCKFFAAHPTCIEPKGYSSLTRAGVGNITVGSSNGDNDALNIWLFDSGTKIKASSTYVQGVDKNQLKWYGKTCASLAEKNGGKVVPSIVFQHFPVEEVTGIFEPDENGVSVGEGRYSLRPGFSDTAAFGVFGGGDAPFSTHLNKSVELSTENSGEYSAWVGSGDVKAAFFGHSHVNDYCGITEDGIILAATLSAGGFNISSRFDDENGERVEARGARVIDIDEAKLNDPQGAPGSGISTFSVYYSDYFDGSIEKYPSKYKELDEHSFSEWLSIEFGYIKEYIFKL